MGSRLRDGSLKSCTEGGIHQPPHRRVRSAGGGRPGRRHLLPSVTPAMTRGSPTAPGPCPEGGEGPSSFLEEPNSQQSAQQGEGHGVLGGTRQTGPCAVCPPLQAPCVSAPVLRHLLGVVPSGPQSLDGMSTAAGSNRTDQHQVESPPGHPCASLPPRGRFPFSTGGWATRPSSWARRGTPPWGPSPREQAPARAQALPQGPGGPSSVPSGAVGPYPCGTRHGPRASARDGRSRLQGTPGPRCGPSCLTD